MTILLMVAAIIIILQLTWILSQLADYWETLQEFLDKRDKLIINNFQRKKIQDFNRPGDI